MIKYLNLKNNSWNHHFNSYKTALFIDKIVFDLWDEKIFQTKNLLADIFTISSNETIKTRQMKEKLEDELFQKGYSKDSLFLAIGGGALCDLVGYLASTFCRGVRLILVPTTLVAMIDASIGGKNGINTLFGKNLIGTIYHPGQVWIDPIFLSTLHFNQIQEGYMEMLKHGLIFDSTHFDEIVQLNILKQIPSLDSIQKSIHIKQSFVAQDEYDQKNRQILNFGHTFAHGLEKLSNYQISHGNAVAIGMLIESYISYLEKDLSFDDLEKIYYVLMPVLKTIPYQSYPVADWKKTLLLDKKNKDGKIYTVRLKKIGQAINPKPISEKTLTDALNWFENNAGICRR